ncbi:phage major tail tube protein [Sphingomonas oligophenolica]|uniref:Phage major tail tube protein n=1 Tax=Sphingomonas oligophenolica TaxID=301154 RepID=A0A502CL40_9SPHN|nr:phage major tail tube protein [Sphingomonas oligophenolica]TPG14375.1 phage major tail tube protein [Sphingomonas oligophenolica]
MAFRRALKDMMVRNSGLAYVGEALAVTPPKLARKFEGARPAGLDREVDIDMGGEKLEMEATYAAPMRDILRQYGMTEAAGVQLNYVGTYVNDETGAMDTVEITVRGRHQEIDFGESKPGEMGEFKVKSSLVYYKLEMNGVTEIEIDVLNMTEIVGGVDRLAARRAAIGI